jgi:NAD(P)H-dependent FMN reductase
MGAEEAVVTGIRILLISGSTRDGSSNTRALAALHLLAHPGLTTEFYDGLRTLSAFVPAGVQPPEVDELLDRISACDAVVFSTPEYAGGLQGTLKNLLDWTVGGGQLYGKPVAWLDVANSGRGAGARAQLRTVLGYVGTWIVDSACVHLGFDQPAERQLSAALAQPAAAVEEVGRGQQADS